MKRTRIKANSAWCVGSPTDYTLTDAAAWEYSPTESTELTEPLAGDVLPQIARIDTDAANFRGCTCLKCTNIARGAPT